MEVDGAPAEHQQANGEPEQPVRAVADRLAQAEVESELVRGLTARGAPRGCRRPGRRPRSSGRRCMRSAGRCDRDDGEDRGEGEPPGPPVVRGADDGGDEQRQGRHPRTRAERDQRDGKRPAPHEPVRDGGERARVDGTNREGAPDGVERDELPEHVGGGEREQKHDHDDRGRRARRPARRSGPWSQPETGATTAPSSPPAVSATAISARFQPRSASSGRTKTPRTGLKKTTEPKEAPKHAARTSHPRCGRRTTRTREARGHAFLRAAAARTSETAAAP